MILQNIEIATSKTYLHTGLYINGSGPRFVFFMKLVFEMEGKIASAFLIEKHFNQTPLPTCVLWNAHDINKDTNLQCF